MHYRMTIDRMGAATQVCEIARDGTERDISSTLAGIELSSHVGQVNRLTMISPAVQGEIDITGAEAKLIHPSCEYCIGHRIHGPLGSRDEP